MLSDYEKEIQYDPLTKEFVMWLNGKPVDAGKRTYQEAEVYLDELIDQLRKEKLCGNPSPSPGQDIEGQY